MLVPTSCCELRSHLGADRRRSNQARRRASGAILCAPRSPLSPMPGSFGDAKPRGQQLLRQAGAQAQLAQCESTSEHPELIFSGMSPPDLSNLVYFHPPITPSGSNRIHELKHDGYRLMV